jgi:hypothetical protein
MTIPEIEKIAKIISAIKELDKEIIFIEKTARILSDNIYDVDFSLSFSPIEIHKKVDVLDSDGFLKGGDTTVNIIEEMRKRMSQMLYTIPTEYRSGGYIGKDSKKHSISEKIDESLSLKLLAVILRDKQSKRDNLIVQLKLIGVHI